MNPVVDKQYEKELILKAMNGMPMMILLILLYLGSIASIILGAVRLENLGTDALGLTLLIGGIVYAAVGWITFLGLKIIKPQEALVLTLFGKYIGTLKGEGFYYVNPFVVGFNPAAGGNMGTASESPQPSTPAAPKTPGTIQYQSKVISLKTMTLNNNRQKVNDELGNPIEIGIVVIWRVVDTARAVFNVDNYKAFLSIQCDSALRKVVRNYPYDTAAGGEEMTLRGSSQEVALTLKTEIQSRVDIAGLEILEAQITHLAYAPEIAAAMLQRQQASAIIDARKMIVEGAVGMVEMALARLSEHQVVELDEERKAAMVSNLLVVLCANKEAQPVVNSGSLY